MGTTTLSTTVEAFKFCFFSQNLLQHFLKFIFNFCTLLTSDIEIMRAVSKAKARASAKVVFCVDNTARLMSRPLMPLTNVSDLKLSMNGWFSPRYVSCTNLSTYIAKGWSDSLAFCAPHLNSIQYGSVCACQIYAGRRTLIRYSCSCG